VMKALPGHTGCACDKYAAFHTGAHAAHEDSCRWW
jgi:hypothetical protein